MVVQETAGVQLVPVAHGAPPWLQLFQKVRSLDGRRVAVAGEKLMCGHQMLKPEEAKKPHLENSASCLAE